MPAQPSNGFLDTQPEPIHITDLPMLPKGKKNKKGTAGCPLLFLFTFLSALSQVDVSAEARKAYAGSAFIDNSVKFPGYYLSGNLDGEITVDMSAEGIGLKLKT
jgi:hypothetical protein